MIPNSLEHMRIKGIKISSSSSENNEADDRALNVPEFDSFENQDLPQIIDKSEIPTRQTEFQKCKLKN